MYTAEFVSAVLVNIAEFDFAVLVNTADLTWQCINTTQYL